MFYRNFLRDCLFNFEICLLTRTIATTNYRSKLPGDSPELMPLDCPLVGDIKEVLRRNLAMSFWMPRDNPLRYNATPHSTYKSLVRTIVSGNPPEERIIADCDRIINSTLQQTIDAKVCYIDDSASKTRNGVRASAVDLELTQSQRET